ncbi:MAG: tetratricopeptide repeat protein [Deltaproteobacteria bacterium]
MATRDLQELFGSEDECPTPCVTFLPPFPHRDRILEAFPHLVPMDSGLGKTEFLRWVNFTLEHPDEIWEAEEVLDCKVYHYLNFVGDPKKPPVFVVEARRQDELTEVTDYTLIIQESDLEQIRSGDLVYCLAQEWERERLVRSLNEKALMKYDEDCLDEAKELIGRAVLLSGSGNAYLFNNRGLIHWKMGKTDAAKQDFAESIRLDESNGDPCFNLGLIYFDECDYSRALRYLRRAVEISPVDSQFLTELGHLYLELEREEEALELFGEALEHNPDDAQVDFHLANYFLYKKNKPRKAVRYYYKGLSKEPEDQFALADLAVAQWMLGNLGEALRIRQIFEQLPKLMPYAMSRLVYLSMEMGDYEGALQYYHRALKQKEPFEPQWLHYNAALVFAKSGRPKQAMDTLDLAVRAGGETVIKRALSDKALEQITGTPAFKKLIKLPSKRGKR